MTVYQRSLVLFLFFGLTSGCSFTHKVDTSYEQVPLNSTVLKLPKEYSNVKPDYPVPALPKSSNTEPSILPPGSLIGKYRAAMDKHHRQ